MAGSPHGSARTAPRVRAKLQASTSILASRYGLSRTTVAKWRTRRNPLRGSAGTTTNGAPMGPSSPHSTVLTLAEEAMVVDRRRTLLPLDDVPKNRNGPTRRYRGAHIFDRVCSEHGIEHKLTKPYHPWTNGQAKRMNRTVKEATIPASKALRAYPGITESSAVRSARFRISVA